MYLKKKESPRLVRLPDGQLLSLADLPEPKTSRWVASRKIAVVRAVEHDLLTKEEAIKIYGLSEEELDSWCQALDEHGSKALKATRLQDFRQNKVQIDED